jgi:branched-chain amino acid transport system substrate-binding protein
MDVTDPTLERDRRLFTALVAAFTILSVVFAVVAVAALRDRGRTVTVRGSGAATADSSAAGSLDSSQGVEPAAGDATSASGSASPTNSGAGASTSSGSAAVSAAPGSAATEVAPGGDIVVGSVITQSGPVNFAHEAATVRAWVAWLNAKGGVNGHKLRMILYDDGLDPVRSEAQFRRLVEQDKVIAIVGSFAPLGEAKATAILEKAGVALVPASGAYAGQENSPIAFFSAGTNEENAVANCKNSLRHGEKKVAMVYVEQEIVTRQINSFKSCITRNGGEVVLDEKVQLGQPDYTTTALRLRSSGAQRVFLQIAQNAFPQLWRAMDRQGIRGMRSTGFYDDPFLLDYEGPASEGYMVEAVDQPPHVDSPAMRELKAAVARYEPGTQLNAYDVEKWVMGNLFVEAAKRAGNDLTRRRILQEVERTKNFTADGLIAPITYGPKKHTGTNQYWFFEKRGHAWLQPEPLQGP